MRFEAQREKEIEKAKKPQKVVSSLSMLQRAKNRPGTKPIVAVETIDEIRNKLSSQDEDNPYDDGDGKGGIVLGASLLKRNKGVMDSIQGIEWK